MRFPHRARRFLSLAATGALALALFPAGGAAADEHTDVCDYAESPFTDTSPPHAQNIDCMFSYEVTTGTTETTFNQQGNLNRGQAATLLVQFALVATDGAIADDLDGEEAPFTDIDDNTHEDNINVLYELGLISGFDDNTYRPTLSINRDQFASILFGAHAELGVEFDEDYDRTFDDVADDNPHAHAIEALADEGIFSGTGEEGVFNPAGNITRGQTASVLALSAQVLDDLDLWEAPRLPIPPDGEASSVSVEQSELLEDPVLPTDGTATVTVEVIDMEGDPMEGLEAGDFSAVVSEEFGGEASAAYGFDRDDDAFFGGTAWFDGFTEVDDQDGVYEVEFSGQGGAEYELDTFTVLGTEIVEDDAPFTVTNDEFEAPAFDTATAEDGSDEVTVTFDADVYCDAPDLDDITITETNLPGGVDDEDVAVTAAVCDEDGGPLVLTTEDALDDDRSYELDIAEGSEVTDARGNPVQEVDSEEIEFAGDNGNDNGDDNDNGNDD